MEQRRGKSGHLRKIQKDPESTCNKQEVVQNPKNPLAGDYLQRAKQVPVDEEILQRRWQWLGHIM